MIDFVRVGYRDKNKLEQFVMNQENFEKVYTVLEYHSGEILYPYKTNLENLEIIINEKSGYVKNSVHKLKNVLMSGQDHNYNDFSYSEFVSLMDYLKGNIIDVMETNLTQLEFGLNIDVPKSAKAIIKESILMHNLKRRTALRRFNGKGYLLEFEHYNYTIKVYDKAKQYGLMENILRFEIKFKGKKEFNKLGIYNLEDLKNRENLKTLFRYLMKRFDELLIVDKLIGNMQIPEKDIDRLNSFSSFFYWENLSKEDKRQTKTRHKVKYFKLLERYDLLKTKQMLRNQLVQKFEKLINE